MAMDGLTLNFMKNELINTIVPSKIDKIMQPSADTLIFNVRSNATYSLLLCSNPSFARIQLTDKKFENPSIAPSFCMLLRKHLQGAKIINISQIMCDRIINIDIECYNELGDLLVKRLVIEIMGKHSNIIFINENGKIIDSTKRVNMDMSRVRQILPGEMYQLPPMQNKLDPFIMDKQALTERLHENSSKFRRLLQDNISGLSKIGAEQILYLLGYDENDYISSDDIDYISKWLIEHFSNLHKQYNPNIVYDEMHRAVDYYPVQYKNTYDKHLEFYDTLSKAMDVFYTNRDIKDKIRQKSSYLYKTITKHINRCQNRLEIINSADDQWEIAQKYKLYGELINANMYALDVNMKGKEKLRLANFYDENYANIDIPLNIELSIKENANNYFKRYRKAKIAKDMSAVQRSETNNEINKLTQVLMDLENANTEAELDDIRLLLAQYGYIKYDKKANKQKAKSKEINLDYEGTSILIGKNSIQNDRITGAAKPEDMWLHVQGVPGSHVIIKSSKPSEAMLLYAAKLAAYFSTAREQTTITVDYTQKKHVKKPAQSPSGFVRYKNFKSLIINLTDEERVKFSKMM